MKKYFGLIAFALFFVSCTNVPEIVMEDFEENVEIYGDSMGATLSKCDLDGKTFFKSAGSGGFSGSTKYFDEEGNEVWTKGWTDVVEPGNEPQKPPIDTSALDCEIIKQVGVR